MKRTTKVLYHDRISKLLLILIMSHPIIFVYGINQQHSKNEILDDSVYHDVTINNSTNNNNKGDIDHFIRQGIYYAVDEVLVIEDDLNNYTDETNTNLTPREHRQTNTRDSKEYNSVNDDDDGDGVSRTYRGRYSDSSSSSSSSYSSKSRSSTKSSKSSKSSKSKSSKSSKKSKGRSSKDSSSSKSSRSSKSRYSSSHSSSSSHSHDRPNSPSSPSNDGSGSTPIIYYPSYPTPPTAPIFYPVPPSYPIYPTPPSNINNPGYNTMAPNPSPIITPPTNPNTPTSTSPVTPPTPTPPTPTPPTPTPPTTTSSPVQIPVVTPSPSLKPIGTASPISLVGCPPTIFINEFIYQSIGPDLELIEVAHSNEIEISSYSIYFYEQSNGVYQTLPLTEPTSSTQDGDITFSVFSLISLGNDSFRNNNAGLALVNNANGQVVEFISYGGSFQALSGPAAGQTSVDIGHTQSTFNLSINTSQRIGTGWKGEDFTWDEPKQLSAGLNEGQTIVCPNDPNIGAASGINNKRLGSETTVDEEIAIATAKQYYYGSTSENYSETMPATTIKLNKGFRTMSQSIFDVILCTMKNGGSSSSCSQQGKDSWKKQVRDFVYENIEPP